MSQLHGWTFNSWTTNTDTSSNCNFAEEISKLCNDLLGNFQDLRDEIINVKNIIIKKRQDENARLKKTIPNLQHKAIILETATNSVEQYDQRNNIEKMEFVTILGIKIMNIPLLKYLKLPTLKFPVTI